MAPLGFFSYGGLIAIQSLWAGPWLTQVAGWSAAQAAEGLFAINLSMLFAFMAWGMVMPRLARPGVQARHLITWAPADQHAAAGADRRAGARGRRRALGALVRVVHQRLAEPAGCGAGVPGRVGRAGLVGLQPGDLRRRVLPAVGHRPGDRRLWRCGLVAGGVVPGRVGVFGAVLRAGAAVVSAAAAANVDNRQQNPPNDDHDPDHCACAAGFGPEGRGRAQLSRLRGRRSRCWTWLPGADVDRIEAAARALLSRHAGRRGADLHRCLRRHAVQRRDAAAR